MMNPWKHAPLFMAVFCLFLGGCGTEALNPVHPPEIMEEDILLRPVLSSVSPATGPTDGGVSLTLEGANFAGGLTVSIGGVTASTAVLSSNRILVSLPPNPGAFGSVPVIVRNRDGQQVSRSDLFSYYNSVIEFTGQGLGGATSEYDWLYVHLSDVVVADFNGDQIDDIFIGDNRPGISFFAGNGRAGFKEPLFWYQNLSGDILFTPGDFNNDGNLDLTILSSSRVLALLGDGRGNFAQVSTAPAYRTTTHLIAGDFDSDQKLDLATLEGPELRVWFGQGNGDFTKANPYRIPGSTTAIALSRDAATGAPAVLAVDRSASKLTLVSVSKSRTLTSAVMGNTGPQPLSVTSADLDQDGIPDAAVGDSRGLTILSGRTRMQLADVPVPGGASFIVSRDWNGDKKPDLAVLAPGGSACPLGTTPCNTATVLLNAGSGTWTVSGSFVVTFLPSALLAGDWNKDGKTDLAIANYDSPNLSLHMGDGQGHFSAATLGAEDGSSRIRAGDFNEDGVDDLAATSGDTIRIYLNQGQGRFAAPMTLSPGAGMQNFTVGEFSGDRHLDLAMSRGGELSLFLGDGTGGFRPPISYAVGAMGESMSRIDVADFNEDHIPDMVMSLYDTSGRRLGILLGDGSGGFLAPSWYPDTFVSYVGDVNNDRHIDVVTADCATQKILLGDGTGRFTETLRSTGLRSCRFVSVGDWNQDGNLDLCINDQTDIDSLATGPFVVMMGDATGGFVRTLSFRDGLSMLQTADWNGDSKPDLTLLALGKVRVLQGDGTSAFSTTTAVGAWPVDRGSTSVAVGDYDGDHRPDLAIARAVSGSRFIQVSLNVSK